MTEKKDKMVDLKGASSTMKLGLILYTAIVVALIVGACHAYAAGDPISTVNRLSEFIFSLIRAIGLILLGLGIMQVGLSLKSHDPSQRANGFLTVAGGIIITFTKEILTMITG
jgi:ABC-type amino acid transport system permease subunit